MAKETLKSLILTDTAGKARTLKRILGRSFLVMSTDGFLKDLPKSRLGIDAENNFSPEYIKVRGKAPLMKEIEKESLNARRVFFATSPDGAGEFLAKHSRRKKLKTFKTSRDRLTKILSNLFKRGRLSTNLSVTKSANIFLAKFIAALKSADFVQCF